MTGSKTTKTTITATTGNGKLVPIAPDGGWGWVVVIGSFFLHVFADGFVYAFGVVVERLITEFSSTNTMPSLILCLLTGLSLSTGPVASAFCNKHGCRATAITGSVIAFFGCLMSYYATEMWHLVISVGVFMGIGFGMIYCPAIVMVTMYFEAKRSLATGIAVAGAGVGTMPFSPSTPASWRITDGVVSSSSSYSSYSSVLSAVPRLPRWNSLWCRQMTKKMKKKYSLKLHAHDPHHLDPWNPSRRDLDVAQLERER